MNRIPMTLEGASKLKEELQKRKYEDRPNIIKEIAEARSHGDLKENAEYHAAREKQSFNEGRIVEIENVINNLQEIDMSTIDAGNQVVFGAKVTLSDLNTGSIKRYQIVGEYEADFDQGKISVTSPIARALIGKEVGDVAVVQAPNGELEYSINEVSYCTD